VLISAENIVSGNNHFKKTPGRILNIHIGMNKTGSTSLQHFLFRNRLVLKESGVEYFDRDEFMYQDAHHRLAQSFIQGDGWKALQDFIGGRDDPETMKSFLREEITRSECRNFVISSELFAGANAEKLASGLESIRDFCDIRIIVYIRSYPDIMESALAHRITVVDGDKADITEEFKNEFCLKMKGHYRRILDSHARLFGRDNVVVRVLEREQLFGGDITSDFLNLLGLEKDNRFQDIGLFNVSPGRNGLEYLMILNRMNRDSPLDSRNMTVFRRTLRKLSDTETCSLFNSGLRSDIVKWTEPECRYIAGEYLGREDGVLFFKPGGKDIPGGESYRGLDPEFSVRAGLAIVEKAVSQGAFSHINRKLEKPPVEQTAARGSLKDWILRIPGVRMIRDLKKKRG
jgi:hypothetical protein